MSRRRDAEFNYWPSVADLFLGFCIVALVLWFLQNLQQAIQASKPDPRVAVLQQRLAALEAEQRSSEKIREKLSSENARLSDLLNQGNGGFEALLRDVQRLEHSLAESTAERERLSAALKAEAGWNDRPPVISISQRDVTFPSGSAELSQADRERLEHDIFPSILAELQRFGERVDTIEIVGHTDSQPVANPGSNLDRLVLEVVRGGEPASRLRPGSNVDLGLMRALAVRAVLKPWLDLQQQQRVAIRCYSAGPAILPDGTVPSSNEQGDQGGRRRIEVLFLGLGSAGERPRNL